jgi:hypothetical protein
LKKREEQVLPGSKGVGGRGRRFGGSRGSNDPNNVCTYEYMKKENQQGVMKKMKHHVLRQTQICIPALPKIK